MFCTLVITIVLILILVYKKTCSYEAFQIQNQSYEMPEGIVLINLDRRPERLSAFKRSMDASDIRDLKLHKLSAKDWKTIQWESYITPEAASDIKKKYRKKGVGLTEGAVGCYLSHLDALEYIAKQNKPWLICEDDAMFPTNIKPQIETALSHIPNTGKELVLFHYVCDSKLWSELKCESMNHDIKRIYQFWSTASYYVTPAMAKQLLELNKPPFSVQIDAKYSELAKNNTIAIYGKNIVNVNSHGSDVQMYM
jgi:GR25 family glycosyltransferase involved in LPS biosynthesis